MGGGVGGSRRFLLGNLNMSALAVIGQVGDMLLIFSISLNALLLGFVVILLW